MTEDYEEARQELFTGKKVRVVSNDSQYEGWVVDSSGDKILLDGTTKGDETIGTVEIHGYSTIELLTRDWTVTEVPVDKLQDESFQ